MVFSSVFNRLKRFDAYPKTLDDFRVKTFGGAAVTVLSTALIVILFLSELKYYLTVEVHQELFVDISRGQKLSINIDVIFPRIGCTLLSLDAMDVSGEQQLDIDANLFKERLNLDGSPINPGSPEKHDLRTDELGDVLNATKTELLDPNRCESCYGAETEKRKCCNTCDDVRDAYRNKGWAFSSANEVDQCKREGYSNKLQQISTEGCRIYGKLQVNKVAGNFHIAPGKSFSQNHVHVHDLQEFSGLKLNFSHVFRHLSFGKDYPGQENPLDGTVVTSEQIRHTMYQYFAKVVPTTYVDTKGTVLFTSQYSVTKHQKHLTTGIFGDSGLPGVFIMYELSPMMVKYTERERSFMHFLTNVCAIVGGVFTVAGLVDAFIYHSARAIQKKIELGKYS